MRPINNGINWQNEQYIIKVINRNNLAIMSFLVNTHCIAIMSFNSIIAHIDIELF